MNLKDKVVLITGASSGIGQATAIKFAKHGAKIIVNYHNNRTGAEVTASEIDKIGSECILAEANVCELNAVNAMIDMGKEMFGHIDILINNAGGTEDTDFFNAQYSQWEEIMKLNLLSAMYISQQVGKMMQEQGSGVILNNATIYGIEYGGDPDVIAYSAAKAGLINFTKTLAKLLAPQIRVNAVAPGFTLTPSWDNINEEGRQRCLNSTLNKQWITPEQIADAFLFLAQNDAIFGQVIYVDGGYTLK